jgi:hypothetical protein
MGKIELRFHIPDKRNIFVSLLYTTITQLNIVLCSYVCYM